MSQNMYFMNCPMQLQMSNMIKQIIKNVFNN
jgi:hypothetical protein